MNKASHEDYEKLVGFAVDAIRRGMSSEEAKKFIQENADPELAEKLKDIDFLEEIEKRIEKAQAVIEILLEKSREQKATTV